MNMQVILTQDVPRVGRRFGIVEVSNGYAKNFLFPRKLAEPATEQKKMELEKRHEALKATEEARVAELKELLQTIADKAVKIVMKADDQGHLYKKLHVGDIALALKEQHGITVEVTSILLDSPIDTTGEHTVEIEAVGERTSLTILVEKE